MRDCGFGEFRFVVDRPADRITIEVSAESDVFALVEAFESFLIVAGFDAKLVRETLYRGGEDGDPGEVGIYPTAVDPLCRRNS